MKTIHFIKNFDYHPDGMFGTLHAFYEGRLYDLADDWADAALNAGAALLVDGSDDSSLGVEAALELPAGSNDGSDAGRDDQ